MVDIVQSHWKYERMKTSALVHSTFFSWHYSFSGSLYVQRNCDRLKKNVSILIKRALSMGLSWCGYAGIFLKIHWMKSIWLLDSKYQYKTILPGPWNKFWCLHFPQRKLVLTFFCSQVIALSGIDNLHTQGWRRWNIKRCVCAANVNK